MSVNSGGGSVVDALITKVRRMIITMVAVGITSIAALLKVPVNTSYIVMHN